MPRIWRNLKVNKDLINHAARSGAFIMLDTETTGLGKDDEIIEFAGCKCIFQKGGFVSKEELHCYIKPSKPVPDKITEINGLTNEFLNDKPSEKEVLPSIIEFMGTNPVIGAYNSSFDVRMLAAMYSRCGETLEVGLEIDILKIVRDVFCEVQMPNHKLQTIAEAYGVDEGIQFHSAMDDVKVLIRVTNSLIDDIKRNGCENPGCLKTSVYKLNYYPGFRGQSRMYAITSRGILYYSFKDDKWVANDPSLDLSMLDMADVERQVFEMAQCNCYKDLAKKCRDGLMDQNPVSA